MSGVSPNDYAEADERARAKSWARARKSTNTFNVRGERTYDSIIYMYTDAKIVTSQF